MSDFYFIPSLSHSQYQFIFYNPVYHQYFKPRNAGKQTPLNSNSIPIMSLPSDGTTIWTLDIIVNIIYRATMILIGIGIIWKNSREAIRTNDGMVFKYTNQMSRFLTKLLQKSNSYASPFLPAFQLHGSLAPQTTIPTCEPLVDLFLQIVTQTSLPLSNTSTYLPSNH